ncbi:xanthine dehydrogenase family protein molybdopterin-binding subunit [Arsenicitalea aurantiaca]|uniref:Xanthine dehydrogenase family protein molybdopterin-binding subunit n=1 Tax=Arsenicitalea aurantiaca TaxID=1783274 RepID=A0A433XKM0_9HYPH|nr:xanthine dehydrogenase family protein molybdopterin-binding subunit [Arsenicitalea aurantiaca]RUT34564.1 xanthine dehydrogenase family protein molybdopterin-binding subunit [Arsenicitalea aurantiaca]
MNITFKMDEPVGSSLLDHTRQNVISRPIDRIEGPLKVAGRARYSAEFKFPGMVHGVLVGSTIPAGTITGINETRARALPGVLAVVTDYETFLRNPGQGLETEAPAQGVREIAYFGQPVALVVAETFEAARNAAGALDIAYAPAEARLDFRALQSEARPKESSQKSQGDLDRAMMDAAASIDAVWTTPSQNSAAMEPHASTALWEGDTLIVYGAYQMLSSDRQQLADALGLAPDKVRIIAHYVGGGFGAKLGISQESVAAALAARALNRPVQVVMTRQQVFEATVRRSETIQRVRLAAGADGRLTGIGHETITANLPDEDFSEPASASTQFLYGGEARRFGNSIVTLNQVLSASMRAPGEAVGMLALEGAMDELAEALDIDPVELRKRNLPPRHPMDDLPFSSRSLAECLDHGASAFGWADRNPRPANRREGEWWIGQGMAAAARSNMLITSSARVTLGTDSRALIETDMTDIGTGTYTILAQIAAEMLGLPVEAIDVHLGDTAFPAAAGSGGSFGAASAGTSVYLACKRLRETLAERIGATPEELVLSEGMARRGNAAKPFSELVTEPLVATATVEPGKTEENFVQAAFGAHFAEVGVHVHTGEIRVRRMHGTFAAGRILNEKTARSQCIGGMVFGIGTALTEELVHDTRLGTIVNHDLAEYHLPVHADVPRIDVVFLEERDHAANPLLAKGIGELGISGAGAAIANAVYNACGMRVRDFPLTLDKLIAHLPDPDAVQP